MPDALLTENTVGVCRAKFKQTKLKKIYSTFAEIEHTPQTCAKRNPELANRDLHLQGDETVYVGILLLRTRSVRLFVRPT